MQGTNHNSRLFLFDRPHEWNYFYFHFILARIFSSNFASDYTTTRCSQPIRLKLNIIRRDGKFSQWKVELIELIYIYIYIEFYYALLFIFSWYPHRQSYQLLTPTYHLPCYPPRRRLHVYQRYLDYNFFTTIIKD